MSKIFIGLKKTCLGVLERGKRENDNEIGLKEGGVIEMSTTVLPLRDARSLHYEYLPLGLFSFIVKFIGINTGARLDCTMLTMTVPSTDCP